MFITATQKEFLHMLKESTESGQRFCFIIGSGCSKSSGIPTGYDLANKWYKELFDIFEQGAIDNWINENKIDKNDLGKFYSDIFDFRFKLNASNGHHELERIMENAEPSSGYYFFARHLAETKNNLVITTNFDSLTEDALFIYTDKKPIVIGHESLANFVDLNATRPIIVKVHRGLYFNPKNTATDTTYMAEEWKSVLRKVFSIYTPVVIGYGGNDGSLMSFLNDVSVDLNSIYWCVRDNVCLCEETTTLLKKRKGYCVKIQGFDEMMFMLGNAFGYHDPKESIMSIANRRCETYDTQITKIIETYNKLKNPNGMQKEFKEAVSDYNIKALQEAKDDYEKNGPSKTSLKRLSQSYSNVGDIENAIKYANKRIELYNDASSYIMLGEIYRKNNQFKEALAQYDKALEIEHNNSYAYASKSVTLIQLNKPLESISLISKAIDIANENVFSLKHISRLYAIRSSAYQIIGNFDDALKDCKERVRLQPKDYEGYLDLGKFYEGRKEYSEAISIYSILIDKDIDKYMGYFARGNLYLLMNDFDNALSDYQHFKTLHGLDANYEIALCYKEMGQKDKAIDACKELLQSDKSNISNKTIARTEQLLKELTQ